MCDNGLYRVFHKSSSVKINCRRDIYEGVRIYLNDSRVKKLSADLNTP